MRLPSVRSLAIAVVIAVSCQIWPSVVAAQQRPAQLPQALTVLPDVRTKIESALTTPNALVHADYHNIEFRFGPNLRIDAVIVRIGDGAETVRGLRFQVPDDRRPGNPERSSYVDMEEIDGLAAALASMVDHVRSWTAGDDRKMTALSFTSLDGLRFEIRESVRLQRGFIYTGLVDPIVTPFELSELTALKQVIDQAAAYLKKKTSGVFLRFS
jgi:hypothetical protein